MPIQNAARSGSGNYHHGRARTQVRGEERPPALRVWFAPVSPAWIAPKNGRPGRRGDFHFPLTDEEVLRCCTKAHLEAFNKRPASNRAVATTPFQIKSDLLCAAPIASSSARPTRKSASGAISSSKKSGVIVQNEDGTLEAVTPEEARKRMDAMEPERRAHI